MSEFDVGQVPVAGSLSAKVIRACSVHKTCPLTCKQRRVEDLGEIASFSADAPVAGRAWVSRMYHKFFGEQGES